MTTDKSGALVEITSVRANECSICPAHASRASHVASPPQELVERKSEPAKNRASQLIKMLHQSALVSQMELPDGQLSQLSVDVLKTEGPDIVDLCGQLAPLLPWPFGDVASGAPRAKGNWRARQLKTLYPGFCALLSQGRTVDLATSEVLPIVSLLETHGGIASVRDRHLIFNQLDYLEVIFRHLTLSELGTVCVCVNKTWASAVFGLRPEEAAWAAPASADPWADWDSSDDEAYFPGATD